MTRNITRKSTESTGAVACHIFPFLKQSKSLIKSLNYITLQLWLLHENCAQQKTDKS